jgi:antitoxin PrlF
MTPCVGTQSLLPLQGKEIEMGKEMATTTLTSKGQMTLPKSVRDDLNLKPGDKIEVEKRDGKYVLEPRRKNARELFGSLKSAGEKPMTAKEMDEALGRALAEDDERIRAGR